MSSFASMIVVVLLLTIVGTLTLIFITVKYYWGERGTPPLTGVEYQRQKDKELRLRAKQIENAAKNPRVLRRSSFWDNSKVYKDEER